MSRSRARKNRFKYKTLRRLGFFKIFVMNYPEHNGWVYPTMQPQETSLMESHLDTMCAVLGVSRENLVINAPVSFASSVEEKVKAAIKTEHEIKRERFRGPDLSTLHGDDDLNWAISPWPTKMNLAGVWSNPVDVSNLQGPSFEEVKTEKLLNLAKALKKSNAREYLKKTADILGEDIEVDEVFLGDGLRMFRDTNTQNKWDMVSVPEDSPEWAMAMVAFCRYPELAKLLKDQGFAFTEVRRSTFGGKVIEIVTDTYYLYDSNFKEDYSAYQPMVFRSRDEIIKEVIKQAVDRR